MYPRTRSRWVSDTSGPSALPSTNGSPGVNASSATAAAIRSACSSLSRGTSMRVSALQV
jgi:hypothetical protein